MTEEETRKVPYLADKAKNDDVDVKGKNSSFQARYVSWATTAKVINEHCDGWTWHLKPFNEGNYVWTAPNGTGYLISYFCNPEGVPQTDFFYAIMKSNQSVALDQITARVLADNTRRCYCANACKQFSYAHQLWRNIEIEDEKNLDEDTTPTEQQQTNPDIDDGDKPIPKEHKDALKEELKEKCKEDPDLKGNVISKLQDITPDYAKENNPSISKFLTQKKHYIAVKDLFKQGGVKT